MKSILKSLYQYSRNKEIKELIFGVFNKDWETRYYTAKNKEIPIPALEKLSEDKIWQVRIRVAKNPSTPDYVLEKLSNDKENIVRLCVNRKLNDKKLINKISFLDYLKDLFYNLFKKKKKESE